MIRWKNGKEVQVLSVDGKWVKSSSGGKVTVRSIEFPTVIGTGKNEIAALASWDEKATKMIYRLAKVKMMVNEGR